MELTISKIWELSPKLFIKQTFDNNLAFKQENDIGSIEYKRTLSHCSLEKIQQYASQMKWRISENNKNIAIYYIGLDNNGEIRGLSDNEVIDSIINFKKISDIIKASIKYIHIVTTKDKVILKICVKLKKIIQNYSFEF